MCEDMGQKGVILKKLTTRMQLKSKVLSDVWGLPNLENKFQPRGIEMVWLRISYLLKFYWISPGRSPFIMVSFWITFRSDSQISAIHCATAYVRCWGVSYLLKFYWLSPGRIPFIIVSSWITFGSDCETTAIHCATAYVRCWGVSYFLKFHRTLAENS